MILQLNPTIPIDTSSHGKGFAHFLLDYSQEHHSLWGVFIDETGEFWWVSNQDIRLRLNVTMGRPSYSKGDHNESAQS